ncbi:MULTISPECIES: nuclear transport factor 2 family protein [Streptomyces]|uniref:nuclear transport factor 2 family protein n=1 Tax=Streptomyces TaxID=1883 RepID=UPI002E369466|nr:nuclear transport factor 2 family protein [Streptomyces sp. NBC_01478]WSX57238.1 nuclear transport factor 2 family protein [Streptomyces sp. NBC_00986]
MPTPLTDQPQDDLAVVRAVYDFINGVNPEGAALADPEITVHQSEELPWGGSYEGLAGFQRFYEAVSSAIHSEVETETLYQAGDRVVQSGRSRGFARATGKPFDVPETHIWRVRNGRITDLEIYVDTPALLEVLKP